MRQEHIINDDQAGKLRDVLMKAFKQLLQRRSLAPVPGTTPAKAPGAGGSSGTCSKGCGGGCRPTGHLAT